MGVRQQKGSRPPGARREQVADLWHLDRDGEGTALRGFTVRGITQVNLRKATGGSELETLYGARLPPRPPLQHLFSRPLCWTVPSGRLLDTRLLVTHRCTQAC